MFNIIFPQKTDQRYWNIHYLYVLNIFKYLKCNITYQVRPDFIVTINGKDFLFDFWDTSEVRESELPTFKFHCKEETDKVFAFPPVSFYDWDNYYRMDKEIRYSSTSNYIYSCRQRPYGGAQVRRQDVHKLLKEAFGEVHLEMNFVDMPVDCGILTHIIPQVGYWYEVHNVALGIFVPGYCNNMVDRGHLQYMGLGCCTVSPFLPERLPFHDMRHTIYDQDFGTKELIGPTHSIEDGKHYIQCKDDYSDLVEIIKKHRYSGGHRDPWESIARNAKQLFKETCTPEVIGKWITEKL